MSDIAPFLVIMAILVSASLSDIRKREISDLHWIVLCVLATLASCLRGDGPVSFSAVLLGCSLLSVYMFSPVLVGWKAVPVIALGSLLIVVFGDPVTPIMFAISLLMYRSGMFGGADAKALMSLSMMYPWYPDTDPENILIGIVCNPVMTALTVAFVLTVIAFLPVLFRNIRDGCIGKGMFSSFGMSIEKAERSFVWPVEDVIDGKVVRCGPVRDDDVFGRLRDVGRTDVVVAPMIPFMVPLTLGFFVAMTLGNPILGS